MIYSALDSHQYARAIKHCQQHPTPNDPLVAALLAHAYAKSGHRTKALVTIQSTIFMGDATIFPELQLELRLAMLLEESSAAAETGSAVSTVNTTTPPVQQQQHLSAAAASSAKKAGKKTGKKKGTAVSSSASASLAAPVSATASTSSSSTTLNGRMDCGGGGWDLVDQLDTVPTLPSDWEKQIPSPEFLFPTATAVLVQPTPTLLATLSMTMLTTPLRLPLTAYQIYCWAIASVQNDLHNNNKIQGNDKDGGTANDPDTTEKTAVNRNNMLTTFTQKAYLNGLVLLLLPQYQSIHAPLLSQLQVWALQAARLRSFATAWAAQTAVWQMSLLSDRGRNNINKIQNNNNNNNNCTNDKSKDDKERMAMLPRLAESLALKCVQENCRSKNNNTNDGALDANEVGNNTLLQTESFQLYLRTLDMQQKWTEKLSALEECTVLSRQAVLGAKRFTLAQIPECATQVRECVEELLQLYPDDWEYWIQYVDAAIVEARGDVAQGCTVAEARVQSIIASQKQSTQAYPLRSPHLMRVELAARRVRARKTPLVISSLIDSIIQYGNSFSSQASCIYSDLRPYLQICLEACTAEEGCVLLKWSDGLRSVPPSSDDPKLRRCELRVYIFAVQVKFHVLSKFVELCESELPSWQELVRVWKSFLAFEIEEDVDQVCLTTATGCCFVGNGRKINSNEIVHFSLSLFRRKKKADQQTN